MKNKMKKIIGMIYIVVCVFGIRAYTAIAAEESTGIGFDYNILFPANQLSHNGYFDLMVAPGQKQTVTIRLINPTAKKIKVNVQLTSAKTNSNGVIDYHNQVIEKDASLKADFEKIVSAPKQVTLAPYANKELPLTIQMPKEAFKGIVLGGIYLEKEQQTEKDSSQKSVVKNVYAYSIGMVLKNSEQSVPAELKLNGVYPKQSDYASAIFLNLSNITATIVENMQVETQITKKGSSEVLFEANKKQLRMAPNSLLELPIEITDKNIVAGEYLATIKVKSKEMTWEWQEPFTVSEKLAFKMKQQMEPMTLDKQVNVGWLIVFLLGIVFLIGVVFWLLRLYRKWKGKANRHRHRSAKKKDRKK